ncbi:hypothetical protein D3C81_1420820 [compost metagenome]
MAVIRTFELHDFTATGIPSRQTNRAHRRFRPRIDHTDDINRRYALRDQLGHLRFQQRRRSKACPFGGRLLQRSNHLRMSMTHNQRAPGTHIIDKAVAVDVIDPGTAPMFDIHWRQANGFKRPHRAVDAAGQNLLRFFES